MTTNLARRIAQLEARRPAGKLLVCGCAMHNLRVNLEDGQHLPGCPVLTAGPHDHVVIVRYEDGARVRMGDD